MFGRAFWMILALGAAIAVPYVATEWSKLKASVTGQSASNPPTSGSPATGANPPVTRSASVSRPLVAAPPSDATPIVNMAEAFRFNVNPRWVVSRWPRVSAGLPDEKLFGQRVTLITGTREDDVAGSLTYYFTPSQRCAKITFSGTTGDARRLTALMKERFGFKPFTTSQPGALHYEIRWNGTAHSEYNIRPASIVRATSPHSRYEVQLVITEPAAR